MPGLVDDLAFASAEETAALVRAGDASPREVVEAALRRIEALDPALNAFIEVDAEKALEAADAVVPGDRAPFAGVPIAIKGNIGVAGYEINSGSKFLAGHRPDHSAYLVRRLREAGFVIVGITNLPEFAILPTTEPRHTGPTRNPWDLDAHARRLQRRQRGGGRVGDAPARARQRRRRLDPHPRRRLRPGRASSRAAGACRAGPDLGDSWLGANGVLTRTVADTAIALDVLGGYEVGDANWAPRPLEPYVTVDAPRPRASCGSRSPPTNPFDAPVDEEAIHGLRVGAELLAALGHEVVEAAPAWPTPESLSVFISVFGPVIALGIDAAVRRAGPRAGRGRDRAALARDLRARAGRRRRSPTSARSRSCRRSPAASSRSSPTTTC